MKKNIILTISIFVLTAAAYCADNFKDGNKLYLDGKYQDALNEYQQFVQKNSDRYEGYYNAGNAFFRQEQYDGALNMYNKAQELNPKDPDIQYNIEVTKKKLAEKKSQDSSPKSQDKNKQNQQGQQNQSQNSKGKSQNGKQGQGQQQAQSSGSKAQEGQNGQGNKQPPSGMTEDEVQALLNQKQNQEKQLKGYFGKQYKKNSQEPDMFNMSPQEMMQYMQQRMMDPFNEQQPPQKNGKGQEKDW